MQVPSRGGRQQRRGSKDGEVKSRPRPAYSTTRQVKCPQRRWPHLLRAVPVTRDGLGVEGFLHVEHLARAVHDVAGYQHWQVATLFDVCGKGEAAAPLVLCPRCPGVAGGSHWQAVAMRQIDDVRAVVTLKPERWG